MKEANIQKQAVIHLHNLLIVDDETMLVNSLYEYINRHHAAEYECLKATSAKQALEIAEHIRVDIAVLDIEMPGMDGLELSGHIRQMYPYCHIIFLTAYDRFDYAYAAAQKQQTRFLLKTEGYGSVMQMVQEESELLDQELMHTFPETGGTEEGIPDYGKNDFLRLILNSYVDAESIQQEAQRFPMAVDTGKPVMPVLLRKMETDQSYAEEKKVLKHLISYFKSWFQDRYRQIVLQLDRNHLLFLMQPLEDGHVQTDLKQELELFLGKAIQASGRRMSLAMADQWTEWDSLAVKVRMIREKLDNAPEDVEDYVCQLDPQAGTTAELIRIGDRLVSLIKGCDEEGIRNQIREALPLTDKLNIRLSEFLYRQFERILMEQTWSNWDYSHKQTVKFAYQLEQAKNEDEMETAAVDFARELTRKRDLQTSEELKYILRKADEFIEAHYAEDISLTDIARYVCLSSSYLSRTFKKETGMSTVDRIKEVRIREAVRLLKTTNMKVQDIAAAVGYHSSRYFLSVFRSEIGTSPAEYREGKHEN